MYKLETARAELRVFLPKNERKLILLIQKQPQRQFRNIKRIYAVDIDILWDNLEKDKSMKKDLQETLLKKEWKLFKPTEPKHKI
jgi:hypothetical protein